MKQSKLRRRRVIRYAILYFTILVVFVALLAGPTIVGSLMDKEKMLEKIYEVKLNDALLAQPDNSALMDNTRNRTKTGTGAPDYSGVATLTETADAEDAEETDSADSKKFRFV